MQKKWPWLSLLIAAVVAAPAVSASGLAGDGATALQQVASPGARADVLLATPATALADGAVITAAAATVIAEFRNTITGSSRAPRPRAQSRSEGRVASGNKPGAEPPRRNNRNRPAVPATAAAAATSGPRLQLEAAEPPLSEEAQAIERAIEVVARAASAARFAASAASAAQGRINTLERTVGELRNEAQGQRDLSTRLHEQLARQDSAGRWVWPLLALVLLLAGLAWWLARRLVKVQRAYELSWQTMAPAAALPPVAKPAGRVNTVPLPLGGGDVRRLAPTKTSVAPAWPPPVTLQDGAALRHTQPMMPPAAPREFIPDTVVDRTEVLPPVVRGADDDTIAAPRDVSIEELIDLEQQAEFFVVLGQDDAAIELLTEHLRHTGGGSPLPYLKLMEIFGRRGDRDDYERLRTRFNHRFNAYAPDWGSDPGAGRSLEDYAGIVPRLQQVWPRPLDAMAEMEALLFRKSRGDLFDLPAYRELLFLYSLARDLLDREAVDTGTVDLLLPLSSAAERGGDFGSTAPAPFLGLEPENDSDADESDDDRPTMPLDFDLSTDGERQTSIFDPLDRHGGTARRR